MFTPLDVVDHIHTEHLMLLFKTENKMLYIYIYETGGIFTIDIY